MKFTVLLILPQRAKTHFGYSFDIFQILVFLLSLKQEGDRTYLNKHFLFSESPLKLALSGSK